MLSKRAVLILKGDIPADKILETLKSLMKHIPRVNESGKPVLEPCNVFALICGSGNAAPLAFLLSRSQASIVKCQKFVEWINTHQHALEKYPEMPPFVVPLYSKLKTQLKLICDCAELCAYKATAARGHTAEPTEPKTDGRSSRSLESKAEQSCHVFIWKPRESTIAHPNHLASRSVGEDCAQVYMSNMEALLETLEFRDDWCEEFPLHGMANEASAGHGSHEYQICIVLRAQSSDALERLADSKVIQSLELHFGSKKVFDIEIHGTNKDVILEGAAGALASELLVKDVQEGVENLAVAAF